VPIPSRLVELLRSWIDVHELGPDGLLFRTRNDRRPAPSNWSPAASGLPEGRTSAAAGVRPAACGGHHMAAGRGPARL